MKKTPKCKDCKEDGHYAISCRKTPRKPIKSRPVKPKAVKAKTTKPKAESRSKLVKKLDIAFSKYIRLRDDGKGCVTCGEKKPWKEMQACHFYTRGRYPTRWDETNVHSGCYRCNVLLKGNYIAYTKYMIDRYGREYVDELEFKSLNGEKIPTSVIKEKFEEYKHKISQNA